MRGSLECRILGPVAKLTETDVLESFWKRHQGLVLIPEGRKNCPRNVAESQQGEE